MGLPLGSASCEPIRLRGGLRISTPFCQVSATGSHKVAESGDPRYQDCAIFCSKKEPETDRLSAQMVTLQNNAEQYE